MLISLKEWVLGEVLVNLLEMWIVIVLKLTLKSLIIAKSVLKDIFYQLQEIILVRRFLFLQLIQGIRNIVNNMLWILLILFVMFVKLGIFIRMMYVLRCLLVVLLLIVFNIVLMVLIIVISVLTVRMIIGLEVDYRVIFLVVKNALSLLLHHQLIQ